MLHRILLLTSTLILLALSQTQSEDAPITPPSTTTASTTTITTTTAAAAQLPTTTPIDVLRRFSTALAQNDVPTAQSCLINDPTQDQYAAALASLADAVSQFTQSAKNRFGKDASDLTDQYPDLTFAPWIDNALQNIQNNHATITSTDAPQVQTVDLQLVNNQWKIDLANDFQYRVQSPNLPAMIARTAAFRSISHELNAGQYPTFPDALTALADKMRQAGL